jgi:hypothetical protein
MDLDPGNYALICLFPDPADNGAAHGGGGMLREGTMS